MRIYFLFAVLFCSCGSSDVLPGGKEMDQSTVNVSMPENDKQINLTILLDLSDRIDPKKNIYQPNHIERDSALISYLTDYFINQMKASGTVMAKGKMRVILCPNPSDSRINATAEKMNIDLSAMDVKGKRVIYETLKGTVSESIKYIYNTSIRQSSWPGADIWRFFKNDVKDIAIDTDSSYRNLLVVFTDGYIYHANSKDKYKNRYAYILPELLKMYKLRDNIDWVENMNKADFGLIARRSDLQGLEVLVVEVTPDAGHINDEDIIREILDKWFTEMKVKRWKIVNSDLPEITRKKVNLFLNS